MMWGYIKGTKERAMAKAVNKISGIGLYSKAQNKCP